MDSIVLTLKKCDDFFIDIVHKRIRCKWLDLFFRVTTHLGSFAFAVIVIFLLTLIYRKSETNQGFFLLICMSMTQIIAQSFKIIINRARPNTRGRSTNLFNIPLRNYSFPSGHTTAAFSMATALSYSFPLAGIFFMLAVVVALSRVYLGIHYPSDVIAGAALGSLSTGFINNHYDMILNLIGVII